MSDIIKRVAYTLRDDAAKRAALENLSKIERRPINQLLNDAISMYVSRRGRKERSLEENLESLRAYRKRDPGFQRAMEEFVEAEATLDDPLEGEPVEGQLVGEQLKPAGPVQKAL